MIEVFFQNFLTKITKNLKKKHPKLPRNSFLISGQNLLRFICEKKQLFGKFVQQRFFFKKIRLMGVIEDKHSQQIQYIVDLEIKLSYSAVNQETDVKNFVKEERNQPKMIMGQAKWSKNDQE